MKKSRNPESKKYAALIQEFTNLETQLKSLPLPTSRPRRRNSSNTAAENRLHQYLLLPTSPRSLMTSLQHKRSLSSPSPSDHAAVEEILRDRRAALSSGKLRGRRLFTEELSVVDFDQSSSVSDPVEKVIVVEHEDEEETAVKEEEESGRNRKLRRGGGYGVAIFAWFGFVLILVTLALASMSCNGKFLKENQLFLVPT